MITACIIAGMVIALEITYAAYLLDKAEHSPSERLLDEGNSYTYMKQGIHITDNYTIYEDRNYYKAIKVDGKIYKEKDMQKYDNVPINKWIDQGMPAEERVRTAEKMNEYRLKRELDNMIEEVFQPSRSLSDRYSEKPVDENYYSKVEI